MNHSIFSLLPIAYCLLLIAYRSDTTSNMQVRDCVVVVTGASMGIGEALSREFLAHGARVMMSSRDLSRLKEAQARVGRIDRTAVFACDVSKRAEIDALVSAALDRFGRIDLWVNNAGYGILDSIATMSMEECRRMFNTNLFGAIECMQAVVPIMKAQGSGTIVNVSSIVGHLPMPHMGAYSATKHGLNAVSQAARLELEPAGIRVISVCPGRIRTNFGANTVQGSEGKRLAEEFNKGITAERCARAIVRGCEREAREIFVPWHGWWLSHLYEIAPQVVEFGMRRYLRRG
jgi:short-subunit dehydrogenase